MYAHHIVSSLPAICCASITSVDKNLQCCCKDRKIDMAAWRNGATVSRPYFILFFNSRPANGNDTSRQIFVEPRVISP